nr:hypothetical protein [Natrarchaeobius chitinivorans]
MTDQHGCPFCPHSYDERTDLRVHLEVEHRKSEIVSAFVNVLESDTPTHDGKTAAPEDEIRSAPSP